MSAELKAKHRQAVDQLQALADTAANEGRDLTADEQARFKALKNKAATYREVLEGIAEVAGYRIQLDDVPAAANESTSKSAGRAILAAFSQPAAGFRDLSNFAAAVQQAAFAPRGGSAIDARLQPLAAAPSTAANEGAGADGGFLVPINWSTNLFQIAEDLAESSLLDLTDNEPQQTGNGMGLPLDVTAPWDTTTGVQARWTSELGTITPSKPALQALELRLKKLAAIVLMSNEMGTDSVYPSSYLPIQLSTKLAWKIGDAILFGLGNGAPLGALSSPAAIVQAKDTSQASGTLSASNLLNMLSKLPPSSMRRCIWLLNPSVLPALGSLTLGNWPVFVPLAADGGAFADAPGGRLLGRPIVWTQHCSNFSSQGDVALVDLSYYQTITKSEGIQTATSMHLCFDADATAFRLTFRMDGAPKLSRPITTPSGGQLSPFVLLAAR